MQFKWKRFLLILLLSNYWFSQVAFGNSDSEIGITSLNDRHSTIDNKQTLNKLDKVTRFNIVDSNTEQNTWILDNFIFSCDNETGYDCTLFINQKKKISVNLFREYDVVDFSPYIYQSNIKDYQYKVILVEAGAERGTAWYYAIVLNNNDVIDSFFIDIGRRYFTTTEKYLITHPEADEMYINPEEFIFITIDNKKITFRFDKKYLYQNEDYLYISKTLSVTQP